MEQAKGLLKRIHLKHLNFISCDATGRKRRNIPNIQKLEGTKLAFSILHKECAIPCCPISNSRYTYLFMCTPFSQFAFQAGWFTLLLIGQLCSFHPGSKTIDSILFKQIFIHFYSCFNQCSFHFYLNYIEIFFSTIHIHTFRMLKGSVQLMYVK